MSVEFVGNSRTIDRFLLLRVVITTLVVGAGLLIVQLTNRDFSIWPICYLLVLSALLGALHYVGFRLGFDRLHGSNYGPGIAARPEKRTR